MPSRHDDIWAIYNKYGGAISLDRLTRYCWAEDVWTDEEKRNMAFAAARRQCNDALHAKGVTGLPMAGPTRKRDDDGGRLWVQLSLWDYDDAVYNLGMRIKQAIDADWSSCVAIHSYIQERYGQAPSIPTWSMPDDGPLWWRDIDDDGDDDA